MSDEISQLLNEEEQAPRKGGLNLGSIILLVGVLVAVATVGFAFIRQEGEVQPTGGLAPDFTITSFDGEEITLSDLRGEVVVLNFWGSWCAPCRYEAPDLQAIHEAYADRGVRMIGITYLDEPRDSLAFIEEFGLTYPNGPDTRLEIADGKYHIDGAPETFVIDQDGEIVHFFYGPITVDAMTDVLDGLLADEEETA